jgi:hypothetical protein
MIKSLQTFSADPKYFFYLFKEVLPLTGTSSKKVLFPFGYILNHTSGSEIFEATLHLNIIK